MRACDVLATRTKNVGTSPIQSITKRARELNALNLAEGFPDFEMDPRVSKEAIQAISDGCNQYRYVSEESMVKRV